MWINEIELRNKILDAIKSQGFSINPHLKPINNEKDTLKLIHSQKRMEKILHHKKSLIKYSKNAMKYAISGKDIDPTNINLKLIEIKPESEYSKIFFWWNLIWWSIPYENPIGRTMRYIVWDSHHNAPFGIFYLQSPTLRSSIRDKYLQLDKNNITYWINQSMYGQRIGALPPYNELLGGKMVALSLVSNEVRGAYRKKYEGKKTILEEKVLPPNLLFISTTSAYGKSSVYERIYYNNEKVSEFIGYTSGSGTFHLPEELYKDCLVFLNQNGINTKRGYGTGPSRKLKLIGQALRYLGLPNYSYHNIKRGYYIFSNAKNLHDVIKKDESPLWYDRPFEELSKYWIERWCIPRSERNKKWKSFDSKEFINKTNEEIMGFE
ncbi:MAG: DUF4338 domain-containing protein [Candidatus Methanofastidiosa archaeon]|jgi:hypothetical protein|nr:DUF4338 domain-containing protein [Candidatus Methanofastidiosa archaeon]